MKTSAPLISVIILGLSIAAPQAASNDSEAAIAARPASDRMALESFPLEFVPVLEPSATGARFCAMTPGYALRLAPDGLSFDSTAPGAREVTSLRFVGASLDPELIPAEPSRHVVNFITGSDSSRWRTGVPTARAVLYKGLYPGIDLKVYGVGREVEYDWIVAPGADPARIRFAYEDHGSARIDGDGSLAIGTALGEIRHRRPAAYQVVDGRRNPVPAAFRETEPGVFGFEVGAFDPRSELVIDPAVLLSSTYIGGGKNDHFDCMAVDASGAIFAAGSSESSNFPLKNALDTTISGLGDAVIVKVAPGGKSLEFSTFLGGNGADSISGIALDRDGSLVVCGSTKSNNFPVKKAFDASANGGADFFVARLDGAGRRLLYATYIGGSKDDYASGVHPGADGGLFVFGGTASSNFPVKNAFSRKNSGDRDAVLLKLSKDGKSLAFSTYYGGSGEDWIGSQAVDVKGHPYIVGCTYSSNLPVKDAFQSAYRGQGDVFLAKFAPGGGSLVYATYFGGPGLDDAGDISVSAEGSVAMAGRTDSNVFPLKNAWDKTRNGVSDVFVAQFAPSGRSLVFSTYLGGNGYDYTSRVDIDADGDVWVLGKTTSKNFPVLNAYNPGLSGAMDGFLARFAAGGQKLTFSTYLGGHDDDRASDFARGADGLVTIVGFTYSANFPVKNAIDSSWNGGSDAFVVRMKVPAAASD